MAMIMARLAGQDPSHTGPVLAVAAQTLAIKDKATSMVITNSLVRVTSSSSQGTTAIQSNSTGINIMFSPPIFAREIRRFHKRAVSAVEPAVPQYLRWSEQPITSSREDHPPRVDNPGQLALVVAPQVGGYHYKKRHIRDILGRTIFFLSYL